VEIRKGLEVAEMSKRRKNQFREAPDAKREALTRAANEPKPEPEWEPAAVTEEAGAGGVDKEE
jgi:hypothetical protein